MLRRNNTTKAGKTYSFLLNEITSGNLKLGEKLTNERDLSLKLNVSRIILREALRALCNAGFLKTVRGDGTYVISTEENNSFFKTTTPHKINDLEVLQARLLIEPEAARLAAKHATAEDLEFIRICKDKREKIITQQLEEEASELTASHDADTDFHRSIVIASHNSILINFFDSIKENYIAHQQKASIKPDMFLHTSKFHRRIFEAIKNKKPTKAAKAMFQHIYHVETTIKEMYTKKPPMQLGKKRKAYEQ